jgi:Zn-dependent peptidase ImmA (M78 family)/transcriptional regulator with XRE-family HTH domain
MALDLALLGARIRKYREHYDLSQEDVSLGTGIDLSEIRCFEEGTAEPSGDQILILADYFKCDYKFFVSTEEDPSFEKIEKLFRSTDTSITKEDKWAIQEFHFLCQCEQSLLEMLERSFRNVFLHVRIESKSRLQAEDAAQELRNFLQYKPNEPPVDVYRDFRSIGFHVFRRNLRNSEISGLFLNDPRIGKCLLVNYDEDVYRQRFTVAHEAAHAILDYDLDFVLSFSGRQDDRESRANYFASRYLVPPSVIASIPDNRIWSDEKLLTYARFFNVNPQVLTYALSDQGLISRAQKTRFEQIKIPRTDKRDPELPEDLSPAPRMRKTALLKMGLSEFYVGLCFEAYERGQISVGRLAEMLLSTETEIPDLARLYGRSIDYDN